MMRRLALVALSLMFVAGCSHKLDDPKPSLATLMPNLVCSDQLTTQVVASGMNLTPIPTKTIAGTEVLATPVVTLSEATDLSGAPMSSGAVTLNNDTDTANTHVRWESESQMSFDVYPDLMLQPGVYDVTITNPDKKAATLSQALGVVPPPSVTSATPVHVCDAQMDEMVVLQGQSFLVVGQSEPEVDVYDGNGMPVLTAMGTASSCVDAAAQLMESIQECSTLTFTVPKDALPPGTYTLKVTNPAPAGCQSSDPITFTIEPPPTLTGVMPATMCAGGGTLTLHGTDFLPTATASLTDSANGQTAKSTSDMVSADGTQDVAKFLVSGGFAAGDKLDVTIDNHDGCTATLPKAVTVVSSPIIFNVDPSFVYDAIVTPVTVYMTAPSTTLKSVTVTPTGMPNATPIDLTANSTIDASHPNHIIINVPGPTLGDGVFDLTIVNQTDCPAFLAKAITVEAKSNVTLDIKPHFGSSMDTTSVTITAATAFFQGGARAYFAPENQTPPKAIPLSSVVFHDAKTLTAMVPSGLAAGGYDLVVVNPDGTVGFLGNVNGNVPFTIVNGAVPSIDPSSPGTVASNCATSGGCNTVLDGESFDATSAGHTSTDMVSATCTTAAGVTSTVTITVGTPVTATAIPIDVTNAAALGAGTTCTFTLTQVVAGVTVTVDGGNLVVSNSSFNLSASTSVAGAMLKQARRGNGLVINGPDVSDRYLYVFGGDNGTGLAVGATLYDSVEFAPVNAFGAGGTAAGATFESFPDATLAASAQGQLPSPRTYVGYTSIGRYIYAIGGMTAAAAATTDILRAEVLSPGEAPLVTDADLTPDPQKGVAPGRYYYRVAAIMAAGDDYNAGGETLASDEFTVNVPAFGMNKIQVSLYFKAGPQIASRTVASWRVYRTTNPNAMPGSEDEYADVTNPGSAVVQIVDLGNGIELAGATALSAYAAKKPLPPGAIGNWTAAHATGSATPVALAVARGGAAIAHVAVSATADVLYVAYGTNGTAAQATYEAIEVDNALAGTPSEKSLTLATPVLTTGTARYLAGGWGVNDLTGTLEAWFGPGNGASKFDHCTVGTGPTYVLTCTQPTPNVTLWAYGAIEAVKQIFAYGGTSADTAAGMTDKIDSGGLTGTFNFQPQGGPIIQCYQPGSTTLVSCPIAYEGATLGGAYFWLAGGVINPAMAGTLTPSNQILFTLY